MEQRREIGQAKGLLDRWWEAFEARDVDRALTLLDPDCDWVLPGLRFRGRDQFKPFIENYLTAFPDFRSEIVEWVGSDDAIALEVRSTGTQTGTLATPNGEVPATGAKVVFESCYYLRVDKGLFISWHGYFDHPAWVGPTI